MDTEPEAERPSPAMPILWTVAALVVTVASALCVGVFASGSESDGVAASNLAAFPLGFVCTGAPVALVVHFAVKQGAARIAAPLGCGCLGGVGLLAGLFFFYAAIWPSL